MSIASGIAVGGRRPAPTYRKVEAVPRPATPPVVRASAVPVAVRGVLWAVLLIAACAVGTTAVALVIGTAAAVAAVSAVRAMPRPLSAARVALAVGAPALAAVSFVIAAEQSSNLALTLALVVCLYDAACYINSDGSRSGGRFGVGAGLASVAVLAVFVAAVFVPPFTGAKPWVVLGLTGLMAPLGVRLAGRVTGWERLPALRRIDSLILAGPVWVILVAAVLHL